LVHFFVLASYVPIIRFSHTSSSSTGLRRHGHALVKITPMTEAKTPQPAIQNGSACALLRQTWIENENGERERRRGEKVRENVRRWEEERERAQ
jgi:hypothetical protein